MHAFISFKLNCIRFYMYNVYLKKEEEKKHNNTKKRNNNNQTYAQLNENKKINTNFN